MTSVIYVASLILVVLYRDNYGYRLGERGVSWLKSVLSSTGFFNLDCHRTRVDILAKNPYSFPNPNSWNASFFSLFRGLFGSMIRPVVFKARVALKNYKNWCIATNFLTFWINFCTNLPKMMIFEKWEKISAKSHFLKVSPRAYFFPVSPNFLGSKTSFLDNWFYNSSWKFQKFSHFE